MQSKGPRKIVIDENEYAWKVYENDDYPRFIKIWKNKNNLIYHDVYRNNSVTPKTIENLIRNVVY
jgi:hypothetical protein